MARPETWCRLEEATLSLHGELDVAGIPAFAAEIAALQPMSGPLLLELADFDIADGMAAVAAVNAVRHLARGRHLVLRAAPQLLAHNLYRVGDLEGSSLVLEATREEEPFG
jgi:ABC-type transporter Mla MlaB component